MVNGPLLCLYGASRLGCRPLRLTENLAEPVRMSSELEAARTRIIERMMLTDPSYDASFDRIVRLLKVLTGAAAAAFTVLEGDRQFYKAHDGISQRETRRDISFCTHTIEQPGMLVVPDARADPRFADSPLVHGPEGHRFYAGIPVRAPSGLPLGALCVLDPQPHEFNADQREALADLAGALEESLMLRSLSVVDTLTGLFNRRHFEDVITREWSQTFAARGALAIAMIDVDHFKAYNDRYGHPAGDACLRAVAGALRLGSRRVGDVLARVGGEEFALVLPATRDAEAAAIGARLLEAIAELDIPHQGSAFGRVTASIGFALVEDPWAESLASALQRADDALYRAKSEGRNQVAFASSSF